MTDGDSGYKFIKFEAIEPIDLDECEPIDTGYTADVILKESIYDLIRMAQEVGTSDDVIDGVLNLIVEERATEIRNSFLVHDNDDDED